MSSLKRPLAVLGLSMFLTVLCSVLIGNTAFVVAMTAVAAVIIIAFMIIQTRHSRTLVVFGIGVVAACLLFLNTQYRHDLTVGLSGENKCVSAVVTSGAEFSQDNARYYVEARLKTIDSQKAYGKIRLSFSQTKDGVDPELLLIGDKINFTGYVYKIGSDIESVHNSYSALGIYLGAYSINEFELIPAAVRPLNYYTDLIRRAVTDKINFAFDSKTSGLIIGMLTGDKDFCIDEVYKNFKVSGAAHILAVSGLHMSIWVSVFGTLFDKLKKNSRLSYLIIILFVIITVFVADFSPSVCRAALMSSLFLVGKMIGEKSDPLNSLGFAMICLLSFNVYVVYSVAFQLTFTCMLSIIAVSDPLRKAFDRFVNKNLKLPEVYRKAVITVSYGIIISLTVTLFTFPVSAIHFGCISAFSVFTNLLIIPVCAPLMVLSMLYLMLNFVPGVSYVLFLCIKAVSGYMLGIIGSIASSSLASINTGEDEIITWLFIVTVLCFIFILYRLAHRYFARFVIGLLSVFIVFSFFSSIERRIDNFSLRLITDEENVAAILVYNGMSAVIGVYDRYYFTEECKAVIESENTKTVAVLPSAGADIRFLEYYCSDLDTENIVFKGGSVVLYDKIRVINKGDYAVVEGNGKRIGIVYSNDLQPDEECDIIITFDRVILQHENIVYSDENLRYGILTIDDQGNVRVRGEKIWQSLTKKNLNPI